MADLSGSTQNNPEYTKDEQQRTQDILKHRAGRTKHAHSSVFGPDPKTDIWIKRGQNVLSPSGQWAW
ncbi:hypothetical protein PoB_000691200 [Plakobranchus ocellatus]|uniref:Uncharacterized protein n=1 Tax=Plakobranchus ocellatus TaxID=259542 RepID=A0AAV3YE48_9GAST|nr:hypothetical protein PoB_000691200 [Plakobranchus ocellatus]